MAPNLKELTEMVADLAEEVALGTAGHIRTKSSNKAMAVWKALRPDAPLPPDIKASDMCLHPRKKDDEDSEVCLKPDDHEGGHVYGPRPRGPRAVTLEDPRAGTGAEAHSGHGADKPA